AVRRGDDHLRAGAGHLREGERQRVERFLRFRPGQLEVVLEGLREQCDGPEDDGEQGEPHGDDGLAAVEARPTEVVEERRHRLPFARDVSGDRYRNVSDTVMYSVGCSSATQTQRALHAPPPDASAHTSPPTDRRGDPWPSARAASAPAPPSRRLRSSYSPAAGSPARRSRRSARRAASPGARSTRTTRRRMTWSSRSSTRNSPSPSKVRPV